MASSLTPFSGFIPSAEFAHRVVGPPSAMLSKQQKAALQGDELSFRNVVGRSAGAPYATAMKWLERCNEVNALQPVESSVIIHRSTNGDFTATGLIADVSVTAYDTGLIKRHETTIAKRERKMLNYMQTTRIFGNPVALARRNDPEVAVSLARHAQGAADSTFESIDGTQHSLWVVGGDDALELCASFSDVLYITDGHHRLAGASALAVAEDQSDPHIPAGLFAEDELRVWAFARAISDSKVKPIKVLKALQRTFDMNESDLEVPRPTMARQLGVRIDGRSFVLTIPESLIPVDPYDQLDVNLLQSLILEPLFDVTNPRTDSRLSFIADTDDAAHDADSFDAWFLPHPTTVGDVMMVADSGRAMPPKSTFFLPKLPSGILIRPIDT